MRARCAHPHRRRPSALPKAGFIEAAGHGELPLGTASDRKFDLAVMDAMMAGFEDLADLKAIRARLNRDAVVVSSRER